MGGSATGRVLPRKGGLAGCIYGKRMKEENNELLHAINSLLYVCITWRQDIAPCISQPPKNSFPSLACNLCLSHTRFVHIVFILA